MQKMRQFISGLQNEKIKSYSSYWHTVKPLCHYDYWLRWLFAFMSIRTTWQMNVAGFIAVRKLSIDFTAEELDRVVRDIRVGLYGTRVNGILQFRDKFWSNPLEWYPNEKESMIDFRDKAAADLFGIGMAKISFVLEMSYPDSCNVVCLDTHVLKLCGCSSRTPNPKEYKYIENQWIKSCEGRAVSSPIARHIYWDEIQNKENTRYWSHVFEREGNICR